jgi:hypothetical protein
MATFAEGSLEVVLTGEGGSDDERQAVFAAVRREHPRDDPATSVRLRRGADGWVVELALVETPTPDASEPNRRDRRERA